MQTFRCEICNRVLPTSILNEHHKIPRSAGGSDDRSNMAMLCNHCHDSMHAIAQMMLNPTRAGQVQDHMKLIWPNAPAVHSRCLDLAILVNKYFQLKKEGGLDLDREENISFTLPAELKGALKLLAGDLKRNGRSIGISRYVQFIVLQHLTQRFPALKQQIQKFVQENIL